MNIYNCTLSMNKGINKVCPVAESKMSDLFNEFLRNLNDFKHKLQKLPERLLCDNKIDHFFVRERIRIVVLGGVGVGKSSLLERLIDREDDLRLPKGKDCCTRQPVTFSLPSSPFKQVDLSDSVEIEFVDLPGITSMSRPDQAADYPLYTQRLFDSYATEADLILLCLPADVDIANSDALRRLKDLQVAEERIICVLSKIDLLERPLKDLKDFFDVTRSFGSVVAVRNAPNLELNNSISETNAKEAEFFNEICELEMLTGVNNLRREVIRLLQEDFIKHRNRITAVLFRERLHLQETLRSLSDPNLLTNILTNYIEMVDSEISGDRIGRLYWKSLPEALESIDPLKGIDREHLRILIKNSQGLKSSLKLEDAFKVLVRNQLKLSETIVSEFLDAVMRELRECLHLETGSSEFTESFSSQTDADEEFFDVKSETIPSSSDSENEDNGMDSCDDIWEQFKMIPGLCKSINSQVKGILDDLYSTTRKYLNDYCAMQRELVYCNDEEYIEAFREYYQQDRRLLGMSGSISVEEIPIKRIESESIDELKEGKVVGDDKLSDDSTGFLKEFMALLFPPVTNLKRVEYRPRPQIQLTTPTPTPTTTKVTVKPVLIQEESFLLKLLEIYLKVHHTRLTDFLPKCVNYHLIGGLRRELPIKLLKLTGNHETFDFRSQIKRIERLIKIIDEINSAS